MPLNFSAFFGPGNTDALRDFNFARPAFSSQPATGPIPRFKRTREEVQNESDTMLDDPTVNPNGVLRHAKNLNEEGGVSARDAVYLDAKSRARQQLTPDEQERFVQQNVTSKYGGRVRFPSWMAKKAQSEQPAVTAPPPGHDPLAHMMQQAVPTTKKPLPADVNDMNKRMAYMGALVQRLHSQHAAGEVSHLSPQELEKNPELLKAHGVQPFKRAPHERLSDALSVLDRPSVNIATLLAPLVFHPHKHPLMANVLGGVAGATMIKRVLDMVGPSQKFFSTRKALQEAAAARSAGEVMPAIRPSRGLATAGSK